MIAQLLAIAALGLHAGPAVHVHQPTLQPHAAPICCASSRNWAGYVAEGDTFNHVTATWTEPKLDCSRTGGGARSLAWAGLDGWSTDTVEQGGSEAVCLSASRQQHWLWWEMYPANTVQEVMQVHAGDVIRASVQFVAPTYVITETDVTTGQASEEDVQCPVIFGVDQCKRSSAEVIAEDEGTSVPVSSYFPLPDYGTIRFRGVSIHDHHGKQGGFTGHPWLTSPIREEDGAGTIMANPSSLTAAGTAFNVTWRASQ